MTLKGCDRLGRICNKAKNGNDDCLNGGTCGDNDKCTCATGFTGLKCGVSSVVAAAKNQEAAEAVASINVAAITFDTPEKSA